jgi:hypothetical protein
VLALGEVKGQQDPYAAVEGGPFVAAVDRAILQELPDGPWPVRDRSLFRFTEKEVKALRIESGGKAIVVERAGDKAWKLAEPAPGGPADETKVANLLTRLPGLRVDGIATERTDRPAQYGLDKPDLVLAVTRTDGKEAWTVLVGAQEKASRYVQIKGEPAVYTIPAKDVQEIPRSADDLKKKEGTPR